MLSFSIYLLILLLVRFDTATCTFLLRLVKSVCWYYLLIHRRTSFLLRAPRIQQRCFRIRIKGKKKQRAGLCSLRHPFSSKSSVCTLGIFKNIILYFKEWLTIKPLHWNINLSWYMGSLQRPFWGAFLNRFYFGEQF